MSRARDQANRGFNGLTILHARIAPPDSINVVAARAAVAALAEDRLFASTSRLMGECGHRAGVLQSG